MINEEFKTMLSDFDIPDPLGKKLALMTKEQQQAHYLAIDTILKEKAFLLEIGEWKRKLIYALAMEELTDVQKQGLKQTVLSIDQFLLELNSRSALHRQQKPLQSIADHI